jgi:hypothetical protein
VPLPPALAPINQTPLVFVREKRAPLPAEMLAVKSVLRELDSLQSLEQQLDEKELEARIRARLDHVKKVELGRAGSVKRALDKVREAGREPTGLASLFRQLRERVARDRADWARLRGDLQKVEALSAATDRFRDRMTLKLNAYAQFFSILHDGVGRESNRKMVKPYADRDGRTLAPDNLVAHAHGREGRATDPMKRVLRKTGLAVGSYARFPLSKLKDKGVVLRLRQRSAVAGIKMNRIADRCAYHIFTKRRGQFEVSVVYGEDVLLDQFNVAVDKLLFMKQSLQRVYVGGAEGEDAGEDAAPFVTEFDVAKLLDHLNEELVLRALLCD